MQLFHEPEAQPGMLDTKLLLKHLMDEPRVRCRPYVRGREKNDQFTLPYRDILLINTLANLLMEYPHKSYTLAISHVPVYIY